MGNIKEINNKKKIYYFFDNVINIKYFDPNLLKIDKKSYKDIDIYNMGYITMKNSDHIKINRVKTFFIIIGEEDGYIEKMEINT